MSFNFNGILSKRIAPLSIFIRRSKTNETKSPSSLEYCLNLIKKYDNENFLCTLLLPHSVRNAAIAVRAFNVEIARASSASKDTRLSLMRLKFWEETIERIFAKNPPEQPVALELSRVILKHDLKKRQFLRLVKAREKQLQEPCFSSLAKMEAYSEETVSPVFYLTLEAAGVKNIHADHVASHIGKAQGISNLLRATGKEGGSWALPKDLLESSGIDVGRGLIRGSSSSKDVVHQIASLAKVHIDKARSLKSDLPRTCAVHMLPAICTTTYLNRLRDCDFDVYEPVLLEKDFGLGVSLFWAKLIKSY